MITKTDPKRLGGFYSMHKQFDTMELAQVCEGVPARTKCVLLDELGNGAAWLVECFDGAGESIDVVTAPIGALQPLKIAATLGHTAA
jgi:hypothetical protein